MDDYLALLKDSEEDPPATIESPVAIGLGQAIALAKPESPPSAIEQIRKVDTGARPKRLAPVGPKTPPKVYCDLIVDPTEYTSPLYVGETYGVLSLPLATTCTLNGTLKGVRFHEMELIKRVETNDRIGKLVCNYGEKRADWLPAWVDSKVRTVKMSAKSLPGAKPPRKKQGTGKCFNSQLTFITAHNNRTQFFKVKVFRTGFIQIPGSRPELIDQSLEAVEIVCNELRRVLECDVSLSSLYLVMKDYKMHAPLNYDQALNLYILKCIFGVVKMRQISGLSNEDIMGSIETVVGTNLPLIKINTHDILERSDRLPKISCPITDIKYNYNENKFSVAFSTPTEDDPEKHIRLVVFPDGYLDRNDHAKGYGCKIDILGAVDRKYTLEIYLALMTILRDFRQMLVADVPSRRRVRTGIPALKRKVARKNVQDRTYDEAMASSKFERTIQYPSVETYAQTIDALYMLAMGEGPVVLNPID